VVLMVPDGLGEVDYSLDGAGSTSGTDLNGAPYTELPGVNLWTADLAADPACGAIEREGLVTISVFTTDPTKLALADGPTQFRQIGQDWYGITSEQGQQCTDRNPAEAPAAQALMQAFATLQAS
jgi:hypothetical protein